MRSIKNIVFVALWAFVFVFVCPSCIHEEVPTSVVSDDQVSHMSNTQESMLYGISSYMVAYNSWGSSSYYLNDWGFPCQMLFREICGEDFPVYKSTYDYWTYHENGTYASSYTVYSWYFYYRLIRNCNNLIKLIDPATAETDSRHFLGSALAFRAMAYMDLARLFEFKPTGFANLDGSADATGIWGLTAPIVTEKTTDQELLENPRAPYCTMYRFILTDLRQALDLLDGYNFGDPSLPGSDCIYGLMARLWMEVGSRMDENGQYINGYADRFRNSDQQGDAYTQLGLYTPAECYRQAYDCTQKVIGKYSLMTSAQWHDPTTGFNTAVSSWMWRCRIGGKEQQPVYYCSFPGQVASEPKAGLAFAYDAYRCIGSWLFSKIGAGDWRKSAWVAPNEAGRPTSASKYKTLLTLGDWHKVPAYANLKFRPGEGNLDDATTWMVGDLPVMRIEEMYFIAAEALARTDGYSAGLNALQSFMATRYESGAYAPADVTDLRSFIDELLIQKRIEFWGEGICFFDYKRLNLPIDRTRSTNYESDFQLVSEAGCVAPWTNFFIPKLETQRNTACLPNPDVSGEYTAK